MISLSFNIKNVFYRKTNFKNLFNWSKLISKYKVFEIEVCRYNYFLLDVSISTCCSGSDHAGPEVEIGAFGYSMSLKIYDTRHWDYENNCWEEYHDTSL